MKVLLLHEMSGVHTELKAALRSAGVEADIATYGDGWKRYPSDIDLGALNGSLASHYGRVAKQVRLVRGLSKYDVVQLISPKPFYRPISFFLEPILCRGDYKKIFVAAGSDAIYRRHVKELKYYPPHNWAERHSYSGLTALLSKFDHVVPVCWEYEYCMAAAGIPTTPLIPFPVSLDAVPRKSLGRDRKLKVFHPLNRSDLRFDFKGSILIKEAFSVLEARYGKEVEFVCAGGMGYQEYRKMSAEADILVDQVYSYGYGMSAAYGLASGQVVLSGMEAVARTGCYSECPVINITPSIDRIVEEIENLILDRGLLRRIGEKSRWFVEEYHRADKVAEQYVRLYERA